MTYSIVAFDPDTGEHGVAVQSNWFAVGGLVSFAEPGVGVVATQANPRPAYGPHGLALMRQGLSAAETIAVEARDDPHRSERQIGMVDASGRPAVHTGSDCVPFVGQEIGEHHATLGNLMTTDRVWGAMSTAYLASEGSLTERLLDALDAGEAAGGDLRGRQSAAIIVVPPHGEPWERVVEVRVEDHPEPLVELRRLVAMRGAYDHLSEAKEQAVRGEPDEAARKYIEAWRLSPESIELRYWAGFSLIHLGEEERGTALLREAIAAHDGWATLLGMMTAAEMPGLERARELLGT